MISGYGTQGWKNYDPDYKPKEYGCNSTYKVIRDGFPLENNLAYYVNGDRLTGKELKLFLNINNPAAADHGLAELAVASGVLTKRALKRDLPDDVLAAVAKGRSAKWELGVVVREEFPSGRGYQVSFIIK